MQLIHACVEPKQGVTFNQYLEWRDGWESTSQESGTTGKPLDISRIQISRLIFFPYRLAVVFAQSIETKY